jgi:rare lipoprotein A
LKVIKKISNSRAKARRGEKNMMKSFLLIFSVFIYNTVEANQTGIASWYGGNFQGRKTASGSIFNTHKLTAAHKTIKLGSKVKVTNLNNRKSVIVLINDRGPYIKGRILDLSHAAKTMLSMDGLAKVSIEKLE